MLVGIGCVIGDILICALDISRFLQDSVSISQIRAAGTDWRCYCVRRLMKNPSPSFGSVVLLEGIAGTLGTPITSIRALEKSAADRRPARRTMRSLARSA
jgi:hypothetical protein